MNIHHRSLCPKKFALKQSMVQVVSEIDSSQDTVTEESGLLSMNETVLMQTAVTEIRNPESLENVSVRILFDSGSHRSYITETLAKKLCLKADGEQDIHVVTFGSSRSKRITTKFEMIDVKLKNGKHMQVMANIVPLISGDLQRRPMNVLNSENVQDILNRVQLADIFPTKLETSPIEILIGNDYYLDFVNSEKMEIQPGLYLLSSKLGWILSGRTKDVRFDADQPSMLVMTYGSNTYKTHGCATIDESNASTIDIQDFWNIESIGIVDKETKTDDAIAMENFKNTIQFRDQRYYVTWPWKDEEPDLPSNKELALGRLKSSINRLKNKPEILKKYNEVICDQFNKGVIEKVESKVNECLVHYIPHHAVITPQKTTTKLRVVYDASTKTKKEHKSLNECLYRGPVMLHDLCGMLMRFRLHPIALVADIEKAFLQIGLQNDQRDVTRFIWLKDVENPTTSTDNLQVYRFCRIPFGVISSPFLLGATLEYHLDSYQSVIAQKIKEDIYVDNVITGTDSVSEAKEFYAEAKRIFSDGSMNLREWISNNKDVSNSIKEADKANVEITEVLGQIWNIKDDTLSFKTPNVNVNEPSTKRIVLKHIASIFDPLGLLCPVILQGKLIMQETWIKGLQWDDPLDKLDQKFWNEFVLNINNIKKCSVPRCIVFDQSEDVDNRLLCFCDASHKAYCAAIYLHQTSRQGPKTNLLFAKSRLAPVKAISIPRLELLAVVIGFKCLAYVKSQIKLPISQAYVWTDSKCVLSWIMSKKQLSLFVKNRVASIKQYQDIFISYVPSKQNPADIGSRGTTTDKLFADKLWWHGPEWLSKSCSEWPKFDSKMNEELQSQFESELRGEYKTKETTLTDLESSKEKTSLSKETESPMNIDINRFSSLTKLLRVTALVSRFVKKLQRLPPPEYFITSSELSEAEHLWLTHIQRIAYGDVFEAIRKSKVSNLQKQLGLFEDQSGLLRCKGRMENAGLNESARVPILLPNKSKYTNLIIEKTHKELMHSGVSQTLSTIRQRFWIPQGRQRVKAVLKICMVCRRFEGGSYKMPPMCPFPRNRVTEATPFARVGLDYLGPLCIKLKDTEQKVWICLFTCLVTRAIHLEVVNDMTSAEFLMCFKRFVSQKGTPSYIFSDNAKQFQTASIVVDRVWNRLSKDCDIMNYVSNSGIKWTFNVELSPWSGGFYERLVGLVKRALRKTIGRKILTLIQLQTLIKEIESVINSRPLVYVGEDINSNIPISPAHFLTLNPKIGIPEMEMTDDAEFLPKESTFEKLLTIWKKGQKLLDMFWKTWRQDYLLSLRERTQTSLKDGRIHSNFQAKEDDIVLIKDDTTARGNWKFGKVTKLVKSCDGCIRSAKVITASGREIGRPLNLLFPLEVSDRYNSVEDRQTKNVKITEMKTGLSERPKRRAGEKAKEKIRTVLRNEMNDSQVQYV